MNSERIKKANDKTLLLRAIEYHISASDNAFADGDCERSRLHRNFVNSLREQLRGAGDTDGKAISES